MKLTTGRWTLWTDGVHPFAPQNERARRQLALELYAPKGGMTTWLYLILAPTDDAGPLGDEPVEQTQHPSITSRLYSTHGDAPAPQGPEETARTIAALREAGLRIPPHAMLQMGVRGELAALWAQALRGDESTASSLTLGRAAEAWAPGAPRALQVPLRLVGAAWEEVGINLFDLKQMARVLHAAQATPPTTDEGLNELVMRASATLAEGPASLPLH